MQDDKPDHADRVIEQFGRIENKSETWAIALAKSEGGVAFKSGALLRFIFEDNSSLVIRTNGTLRHEGRTTMEEMMIYNERAHV